ncbi:MAG: beta-ketoacyl synthase N-terminal-like domain-containing protein, partial [Desulfobacterales bacterium]
MKEAVIVSGSRTAIGAFGGGLKDKSVVELGSMVMKDVLKKVNLKPVASSTMLEIGPDKLKDQGLTELEQKSYDWGDDATRVAIDEVIMGNVLQAALGQNPGRQSLIGGGIPKETPACTINKVCGSGLKAIAMGAAAIMTGQADVVLAGGMENMSQAPMALPKARWGHRMELTGVGDIYDLMVFDGLYEIFYGYHMGVTAENIASLYDIS